MSDQSTTSKIVGYILPPLFVAGITAARLSYMEGHSIDSEYAIAEILINIAGYETAKLCTELFLDKMLTNGLMIEGTNHVFEPLIHGTVVGLVPMTLLGEDQRYNLQALGNLGRDRRLSIASQETFFSKFIDGVVTNVMSTWLSQPITDSI